MGSSASVEMPLFSWGGYRKKSTESASKTEYKARLEHKLYLARETPEPVFDLSECNLKEVPDGVFSLCKVFRKEVLCLQVNHLECLSGGGNLQDLQLLTVLNLHSNRLRFLPEGIGGLVNLKVLDVSDNKLRQLPKSLGRMQKLQTLNVSHNKLQELPDSFCSLSRLCTLNMSSNRLHMLPKEMCRLKHLVELELDAEKFEYPPTDVAEQGVVTIMMFLCQESGVEYVPPSECLDDNLESPVDEVDSRTDQSYNYYDHLQDKLLTLDKIKDQKKQQMLQLEQQMSQIQQQEAVAQQNMQNQREKFLMEISAQHEKLEQEVVQIQKQKDQERSHLVQQLAQVEEHTDNLISQLMAAEKRLKNPQAVLKAMEREREEMDTLIIVRQEEQENLRQKDVLEAMQKLLQEEILKEHQRKMYEEHKTEMIRSALDKELEADKALQGILDVKGQAQKQLIDALLEDEKYQREAFEALFVQQDERNQQLLNQIELIENELAMLTVVEMKKKQLKVDFEVMLLAEKREQLTDLLVTLIGQQSERQAQLKDLLEQMEAKREESIQNYWLIQYQRLLDSKPSSLNELQDHMDQAVKDVLVSVGGDRYIVYFAREHITMPILINLTEEDIRQIGVSDPEVCAAILKAANLYSANYIPPSPEPQDNTNKLAALGDEAVFPTPSAPTEEDLVAPSAPTMDDLRGVHYQAECVVCMDNQSGLIFLPCGHVCCCPNCGNVLENCPLCRSNIVKKIKLFV